MVFLVFKWYAILKGVKLAIARQRRVNTVGQFNFILKEHYVGPLKAMLAKEPLFPVVLDEDVPPGYIYLIP